MSIFASVKTDETLPHTSLIDIFTDMNLTFAVIAQLVEHQLPKLRVASSSLVYRSS